MKLLVLQHVAHEPPGYIADYARDKDVQLDVVELWKPYTLPSASEYRGVIILGGPMGVYEDFASKHDEITLIKKSIDAVPMLGICLGSQLIAHALGAEVKLNPKGKEVGHYDVHLTPDGAQNPLFKGFSNTIKVLQWHGDAFDLPEGAIHLASSPICEYQAFAFKKAFGTLFHFEFTERMVRTAIKLDHEWTHKNFDLDEDRLLTEAEAFAPLMKEQCYRVLNNFLNI